MILLKLNTPALKIFQSKKSLVVEPITSYIKNFSISEKGNDIIITTAKMKVVINRSTQSITYTDLKNNIILAEAATYNKVCVILQLLVCKSRFNYTNGQRNGICYTKAC